MLSEGSACVFIAIPNNKHIVIITFDVCLKTCFAIYDYKCVFTDLIVAPPNERFLTLLALSEGHPPVTSGFHSHSNAVFEDFFDVSLNGCQNTRVQVI